MVMTEDGAWRGPVFVLAPPDIVRFFRRTASLLADLPRIPPAEVDEAEFFGLDGEVLALAADHGGLRWAGQVAADRLTAALASLGGPEAAPDPRTVANQVLQNAWSEQWPARPTWLHHMVHGRVPPTV